MGAGFGADVGIDSEPSSSHRADIQEARAELRQELSGRTERQRELQFLEKGGDPLEFKLGELPRSLSAADPYLKRIFFSGGRGDADDKRQDKSEDGSDLKRPMGLTGKFCYQDVSATSVSVEGAPSDALGATVSSSGGEHDREDPLRKELDACKNNKVAVKGQYARRNRQRSNRFSNGLTVSQELGKVQTEGGSRSSTTTTSDAEAKGVLMDTAARQGVSDELALRTRDTGSEVAIVEMVSAAVDVSKVAMMLQNSSPNDNARESSVMRTVVLEVAKEASATEGAKSLDQLPPTDSEGRRSVLITARDGGELDALLSVPHDALAQKSTSLESLPDSNTLITKEDKVHVIENSTTITSEAGHEGDQSNRVSGLKETKVDEDRPVFDNEGSPARHPSVLAVPLNSSASGDTKTCNIMETAAIDNQEGILSSDTSNLEKGVLAKDEDPSVKMIEISLKKEIDTNKSGCEMQPQEDVKVKVEDEEPSHSRSSPVNVSSSQKALALQPQYVADGSMNALSVGAVFDEKGSVLSRPKEARDSDVGFGINEPSGISAENAERTLLADTVGIPDDSSKGKNSQEAPRKCSHWDFVLQEMAWMANDFMQERLWKVAAASQVARWVAKEKQQLEFEEIEIHKKQRKLAQSLSKAVKTFWQSVEGLLLKDAAGSDSIFSNEALKSKPTLKCMSNSPQVCTVRSYAIRFLRDSAEKNQLPQAEAPPTPDRVSEFGIFDFWDEQLSEESLFYTIPENSMEVYRQLVVSQWEGENEQRLQEHEVTMAELEPHVADGLGPLVSPFVTGKRSSGFLGGTQTSRGSVQTKRMRTSAVAARHRAAGGTGPLVSIPVAHLVRSDISSCETNSQQDEMTAFLEGSSVSGRATDVDSNGAFVRNHLAVDGVDSPLKSKKKKKTRHLFGHTGSIGLERESEQVWQHNYHRQSEQKEQSKQKGDQTSLGLEGLGTTMGSYHGATCLSSANKLIKQISSRDRNRKHKVGKALLNQPGVGIPWSSIEDQAIIGLVHELGLNWELVSDILSATSQLRGIFRKPKDCKERYRMLTDKGNGDGGESPDDPSSSAHHSMSYKGGTRYLPQHLEETLKAHVDCILHLHQQLRNRKIQNESQEPKQLVPEHESHAVKHTAMTPLELCELSSVNGEMVSQPYPLQPAGMPSMLSAGVDRLAIRPTSAAITAIQGVTNLQISPSMSPSASINVASTRDIQRMGVKMKSCVAEEQRLRYSRMVAGRGLPTQGFSATPGSPVVNMPNTTDGTAPANVPSRNSAGLFCSLSRSVPVTRTGVNAINPMGALNIAPGIGNVQSTGMGLSGAGIVNGGAVSSPISMIRRSKEAISMGHSPSANSNISNSVVSSPTQNFGVQQQQLQHNSFQSQQQSPSSSQQQAYNLMRVAKERQQLQHQQQKRMLQQQQSPTSNSLQSPFPSSQPLPVAQQQHGLSTHPHLFSQHQQSSHLMAQQHSLQEQQQNTVSMSTIPQSAVSSSGQPCLSGNGQSSQQQHSSSQAHQSTLTASPSQSPFQSKHQNTSVKQQQQLYHHQQQQQQGKNIKSLGREGQISSLPGQVSSQISGQPLSQGPNMCDSQGIVPQHLAAVSSAPNLSASLLHLSDAGVQQPFSQKGFSQHKHSSQQHSAPMSTSSSVQPSSPPTGINVPQQQPSPTPGGSLSSAQLRRSSQQAQGQQQRPQQSHGSLGTNFASQSIKIGPQASSVPPQMPAGYQLGANTNSPLSMSSPSSSVSLSSPNNASGGAFSSAQWKPGPTFAPMAAGLYNLSRSNSGIAAQAPHLAMSVGMHLPLPNGKVPLVGNNLVTQDISRVGSQHVSGHVGQLLQKAPVAGVNPRSLNISQHSPSPQQRQLPQQQQLSCTPSKTGGQQLRASSGTAPAPE